MAKLLQAVCCKLQKKLSEGEAEAKRWVHWQKTIAFTSIEDTRAELRAST